jgi:hypothetical protein
MLGPKPRGNPHRRGLSLNTYDCNKPSQNRISHPNLMKTRSSRQETLKEISENQPQRSTNVHLEGSSRKEIRTRRNHVKYSSFTGKISLDPTPALSVHDNILLLIIDVNKRNLKISGNSIGCEMFLWVKRTG